MKKKAVEARNDYQRKYRMNISPEARQNLMSTPDNGEPKTKKKFANTTSGIGREKQNKQLLKTMLRQMIR
ncbi:MAG: hypothetical protein HC906_01165 [Bacteroidales bacterium]|nr:hypothetical protein [Bacteroidales bacterium]